MRDHTTTVRLNMRLTGEHTSRLRQIAADIQRRKGSPFASPAEAVRTALRIVAETLIREGMATQRAPQ